MTSLLKGKNILVTGGSGSIGKEIVRKLTHAPPILVLIFNKYNKKK